MKNSFWNAMKFYLLEDAPDAGSGGGDLPDLDDVDFLAEGEDDDASDDNEGGEEEETGEDKSGKEEDTEEAEDTPDETEEPEEETEDPEDEETEENTEEQPEVTTDGKISVKILKEQYPDIFKKNPGLKDVIFREREYSKLGPIEDIRESVDKAQALDAMEETLLQGGIGELIDAVGQTSEDSVVKIADNFLPEIYSRSPQLFARITTPVIKHVLRSTFTRANNTGNKQLALAVQWVTRDLFENPDVIKATEIEQERPNPEAEKVKKERQEFYQQQLNTARSEVIDTITSRLKMSIKGRLDSNMSDFAKDALADKVISELSNTLAKDKAHMANLSSIWKKMQRGGITPEAKNRIISASLSRAKQVLPTVLSKVKANVKGKEGKKPVKGKEDKKEIPNQGRGKTPARSPAKLGRNVSDFDFISQP